MPVGFVEAAERPLDRLPMKSSANVGVVGDVAVVVEINKWMMNDRVVQRESCDDEKKAENEVALSRGRKKCIGLGRRADAHCRGRSQQLNLTTGGTMGTGLGENQSNWM
jgi:hypothetical protein